MSGKCQLPSAWPRTASSRTSRPDARPPGKVAGGCEAAKLEQPKDVPLRDPKQWKLIGKPVKRLDTANKVNGRQVYGFDLKLPGW